MFRLSFHARTNFTNLHWIKLDTSLYDVDRRKSSMGDGTADTTGGSTLQVVHRVILGISRRGEEDSTGNVHGQQRRQRNVQHENGTAQGWEPWRDWRYLMGWTTNLCSSVNRKAFGTKYFPKLFPPTDTVLEARREHSRDTTPVGLYGRDVTPARMV